jgi:hypothetical protein
MRVRPATLLAAVLVAATVAGPGVALQDTTGQASPDATPPGARLSGVFDVQGAEVQAAVDVRTLDVRLSRADSAANRAAVVAHTVATSRERLRALERRLSEYRAAEANGSMSAGESDAKTAGVAARVRSVEALLSRVEDASATLPEATLRRAGTNRSAVAALRSEAESMRGPRVAAVARRIAGPDVGVGPPGVGRSNRSGPPDGGPDGTGSPGAGPPVEPGRPGEDADRERGPPGTTQGGPEGVAGNGVTGRDVPECASRSDATAPERAYRGPPVCS